MKITRNDQEGQTALLSVVVEKADYAQGVESKLKEHRKKAQVPGFRPGMVPMGVIKKMYGKNILVDVTYQTATEAAFNYLKEENIDAIGDMMPSETQPALDFENSEEFEFVFQIGLAPELNITLDSNDTVEKVVVTPDAEMITGYTDNFLRRFGNLVDVEVVEKEEALTVVLDNQEMKIEDAYVGLISMSEEDRAPFIGKKVGDKMQVNINELYKDEKQRSAILSVSAEELAEVKPEFELEITQIRTFKNPEVNEELLAMAFPEGEVKTVEEFEAKMKANVEAELANQTEFKWDENVRNFLIAKFNPSLPEEFLKNWLEAMNEGKFSKEEIEKEFPQFAEMMKWDLIKRAIVKAESLEIKQEDMIEEAKNMALAQFRYYGMGNPAEDMLENYAKQILENKEEARKIVDRVGEKKCITAITPKITIVEKVMTVEEFSSMMKGE